MGFIANIFEAIGNAIRSVLKAIAAALKWIFEKLGKILLGLGLAFIAGFAIASLFGPIAALAFTTAIKTVIVTIATTTFSVVKGAFLFVVQSIKLIVKSVQGFLQLINFKELLQIHKIAYLLSADYRNMMNKLYKAISKFSEKVFGNAQMLHMLLQTSRQFIYSLTSSVGYPVDIGEVEWLQTMDETLLKIQDKAGTYSKNPEEIFEDLNEWVYRPMADKYSAQNGVITQTLITAVDAIDSVAQGVFELEKQSKEVISYLPSPLRGKMMEVMDPLYAKVDKFQYEIYEPKMSELDAMITDSKQRQDGIQKEFNGLSNRLIDPSIYLSEIDDFEPKTQEQARLRLDLSTSKLFNKKNDGLKKENDLREMLTIKARAENKLETPENVSPETVSLPPVKIITIKKPSPGWFAGDY
jgi:hypothetical protein